MKYLHFFLIAISILVLSCKDETDNSTKKDSINADKSVEINKDLLNKGENAIPVADSIMYITTVINPDPSEDYYMTDWLAGADIKTLAELIFKAVYEGKLKVYDYVTGEEMTIEDVKSLDTEWKRDDIGQILFTEDWYFDEKELRMYKQVNSVMLAYYRYADDGTLIGNKAGIRVYFNDTKPMRGARDY